MENPPAMSMRHPYYQSCIDACHAAALACEHCAAACLHEPNAVAMSACIALDIDCAAICRLAASSMERNSGISALICETCAEVCERCREECERHGLDHCQECAEACRRCAEQCRIIASRAASSHYHSTVDMIARLHH